MRVCFFNRSYVPDQGATGQLLAELAEDLVHRHGCEVSVVAGRPLRTSAPGDSPARGWPVGREVRDGVFLFRAFGTTFNPRKFPGRVTNYLTYFVSACLAGLLVPEPDIVVALTDPPIIGLAALLTARLNGSKFVFLCEDVFPEVAELLEDFHSESVKRILTWISRFIIGKADRVVVLGETMARKLIEGKGADPRKIVVIHNWADCSAVAPGPKKNAFAEAHGLDDKFIVMHSGNLGLSQNLLALVESAADLKQFPDLRVVFVGEGVAKPKLQQKAKALALENVRFLPYTPKEQLGQAFAAADLFVVSLRPGLAGYIVPSKLYGILAAGRPYLAAMEEDSEAVHIAKKYGCGLIAKPGEPGDLAAKILTLYRDRDLAARMGANARQAALQFDRPVRVAEYYKLFSELAPTPGVRGAHSAVKRGFDIALSGLGLLFSAPLWAIIALAIKFDDGGPVFYGQQRIGRGGKPFRSWKFRSMVPDADERFGPLQAKEYDPRVTRVGRVLRATAMDELPQLWNIFAGAMSFVGPRALMPEEIEVNAEGREIPLAAIPGFEARHRVSPGLTGIAQVYAARDIPRKTKFRYDLIYVQRQSFCLDLKLILLSFWITFRGKWESRENKI
jgi:colanic acid biosynthesis glycosyl transferase WcaI